MAVYKSKALQRKMNEAQINNMKHQEVMSVVGKITELIYPMLQEAASEHLIKPESKKRFQKATATQAEQKADQMKLDTQFGTEMYAPKLKTAKMQEAGKQYTAMHKPYQEKKQADANIGKTMQDIKSGSAYQQYMKMGTEVGYSRHRMELGGEIKKQMMDDVIAEQKTLKAQAMLKWGTGKKSVKYKEYQKTIDNRVNAAIKLNKDGEKDAAIAMMIAAIEESKIAEKQYPTAALSANTKILATMLFEKTGNYEEVKKKLQELDIEEKHWNIETKKQDYATKKGAKSARVKDNILRMKTDDPSTMTNMGWKQALDSPQADIAKHKSHMKLQLSQFGTMPKDADEHAQWEQDKKQAADHMFSLLVQRLTKYINLGGKKKLKKMGILTPDGKDIDTGRLKYMLRSKGK